MRITRFSPIPGTDSRYIGKDVAETLKERLKACAVGPYRKLAGTLAMKPIHTNASFVDDKKVSDHHAIIPTEQFVDLSHMTNEERKIYDLVVRRFLAVLMPPFTYDETTMKAEAGEGIFTAREKSFRARAGRKPTRRRSFPGRTRMRLRKSFLRNRSFPS